MSAIPSTLSSINNKESSHLSHSCLIDEDINSDQLLTQLNNSLSLQLSDNDINKSQTNKQNIRRSEELAESQSQTVWSDDTIGSPTPRRSQYRVTFEIISAKTVNRGSNGSHRKKYVCYTILVKRVPGLETRPAVIDRRYSDFLQLYQSLKKRFPRLLTDFPFPKKTIVGNFTAEVITERSVAFQHLLAYCLSIRELRTTAEFSEFLFYPELKEAQRLLKAVQFEEASNILENVFFIQEKLAQHSGEHSLQFFQTLCVLIACLNAVDNTEEAQKFAEKAIELISNSNEYDNNEMVVPLIVLSIRLRWSTGKDKTALEEKLQQFKQKGINIERQPTLLELILRKDFTIIANI
jgi:hypothetical protein